MATPKDWIVYIDGQTQKLHAVLDTHQGMDVLMDKEGHRIIGYVSAGTEASAVQYGHDVLAD